VEFVTCRDHNRGAVAVLGRVVTTVFVAKPATENRLRLAQVMLENPDVADAYDQLLADLRLARQPAAGKSMLVTSAAPDEGKTTISLCLAITAARAGQKALLVDGDLRRSALTAAIGHADSPGLIELLLGEVQGPECIHPITALAEMPPSCGASFMPGGRRPPTSLAAVDWSTARTAFTSVVQRYGVVFLDSPPILAASDALLFASIVDAVLLVVGTGNANLDEVRRAKEQLNAIGAPIKGAVLNRFKPTVHGPSNRPYIGYYRRSHK
jgi:capsular exopolysaccharide synthesis family protein